MFLLTVEPENPKKISLEEYKGYLVAREALRNFERNKEALKEFGDVLHATSQLKAKVKAYRSDLRNASMKFQLIYKPKNKGWSKLIPEVKHSFVKNVFASKSIINNKKHEMYHKQLLQVDNTPKAKVIRTTITQIREKIQEKKKELRSLRTRSRSAVIRKIGDKISYQTCGAIIHKRNVKSYQRGESPRGKIDEGMGVFMRFLKSKDKELVFKEKKPLTDDKYVGVEIEFGCDLERNDLAFTLMEAGVHGHTFLKTDGSVHVGPHNHELCVLGKETEIFSIVKKVCEVLASANAKVNKTCGLHVHLDMRNRKTEMVFNNLVCAQNILYAMNPYNRQTGSYCKRVDTKDFEISRKANSHYMGINASAHTKHKTIEVRIHSGTINEKKINNWIKLLLLIVNKKDAVKKASSSLREFVTLYGIDKDLADYMHMRMNKFMGDDNKDVSEDGAA